MATLLAFSIILIIVLLSRHASVKDKLQKEVTSLTKKIDEKSLEISKYKDSYEELKKYEPIKNIEAELSKISHEMEEIIERLKNRKLIGQKREIHI